jgi:hypothetical protein
MSFDISRSSFRPRKNFLGVVMQQGRVQLDSDWNEWQREYSRRIQAGTLDTVGQAVYPASTPNAFLVTPGTDSSGNYTLTIGAGRYYVDGLLAENHGPESQATWDPSLAEMSGAPAFSTTTASTSYTSQPYLPGATLPTSADPGPYLAYLDVWQRDVTYLEDPALIDKAVNIDTTGRLQTVWQVKLLDLSSLASTPDCSTDIPGFDTLNQPPAGRLTSGLVPNATSGPCCLAPNTGFTGQENQLYRVEIHQPGMPSASPGGGYTFPLPANTPTFKWSRDNASVQTSVSAIATVTTSSGSVSQITVASLGRDQVLGFAVNDWIEITDDVYELNGQPGEIYQIAGVTAATNTITLNGTVSSHFQLTGGQTIPKLHTRITRWDQSGQVFQTDTLGNTTLWIDLGSAGATGLIPVPPTGTMLVLENGVTVSFDLSPEPTAANPTAFRVGDYWLFTARAADGSVETITEAPPLGINHHYAKLAIVTFPSTVSYCRVEWPPSASGSSCCCTVNVSPSDLTGSTTLQSILDNYQNVSTPTTICLEAGTYVLSAPLRLTSAHSNITIEACQPYSVLIEAAQNSLGQFNDGFIVLDGSNSITLSGLIFFVPPSPWSGTSFAGLPLASLSSTVSSLVNSLVISVGVRIVNASGITVESCYFRLCSGEVEGLNKSSAIFAAGLFLNGENETLTVEDCEFLPGNAKLAEFPSAFFTGIAMASSVFFSPPVQIENPTTGEGFIPSGFATLQPSATLKPAAAPKQEAKPKAEIAQPAAKSGTQSGAENVQSGVTAVLNDSPTLSLKAPAFGNIAGEAGLQNIGGVYQNIYNFGNITPPSLASQGGAVVPATLDEAVFRGNTFIGLTTAALLLGETAGLTACGNQIACRGGFWLLTPSQTQVLLLDPQSLCLTGATVALSLPLPQGDTTTPVTVAAATSVFLYTGDNSKGYTDSNGNIWLPDGSVSSVTIAGNDWTYRPSPPPTVNGTTDPTLYQSERAGPSFSYTFTGLNAGFYSVTLKFAEIYYTNPNQNNAGIRIFDVSINGQPVLTNFDIAADAGTDYADDKTFTNIPSNNGQIVIQFTGTSQGSDPNAKINALSVNSVSSGAAFLGAGNESDSALFFDQLAQLSWQGYSSIGAWQARWRMDSNEMQDLTAAALLLLGDDTLFNGDSGSLMLTGNRIDGEIQEYKYFANSEFSQQAAPNTASKTVPRAHTNLVTGANFVSTYFFNPGYFTALVTVSAVSRAVITSNMLTNGNYSDGYNECLVVYNSTVQQAFLTVMSNVFAGYIAVPARNLSDTTLDSTLQSWAFLNTTLND